MLGIATQCYQLLNEVATGSQAGFILQPRDLQLSLHSALLWGAKRRKKKLNKTKKNRSRKKKKKKTPAASLEKNVPNGY